VKINSDYNDLLRLFGECGVRYLIAGSYAVMKYTEPIWSKDIDIWIDPVPENVARVLDSLRRSDRQSRHSRPDRSDGDFPNWRGRTP
jgi:hypothetical protein